MPRITRCAFRWGESFIEIEGEFWPWQVAEIRDEAWKKIGRAPKSKKLELEGVVPSVIPFELFGYGFLLLYGNKEWSLEVAGFPPHALPGERIRAARRRREARERRRGLRRALRMVKATSRRILYKLYWKEVQLCRNFSALLRDAWTMTGAALQQLGPYLAAFQPRNFNAKFAIESAETRVGPAYGMRLEGNLFGADIGLPIWLNSWAPIGAVFVLGGRSVFGERALESEWVS